MNYLVTFEFNDPKYGLQVKSKTFPASNPGHAFFKCATAFPGCKLIRALVQGNLPRSNMFMETTAPPNPTLKAPMMESEDFEQVEFNLGILGKNSGKKRGV